MGVELFVPPYRKELKASRLCLKGWDRSVPARSPLRCPRRYSMLHHLNVLSMDARSSKFPSVCSLLAIYEQMS